MTTRLFLGTTSLALLMASTACSGDATESDTPLGDESGDGDAADGDTGDGDGAEAASGFGQEVVGGQTRDGFSTITITVGGDQYMVNTNPWGGAEQVITAGGEAIFTVDSMIAPEGGNAWDVASFPSVFRGASYSGDRTAESGMPIAVSEIESVRTGMKTNATAVPYTGNTTYDVYFTNSPDYNIEGSGPPDVYLMVWFHSEGINPINGDGEGWSCAADAPTHIDSCTGAGSVEIDGKTFHRFIGPNGESSVISYAPEVNFEQWEFDLNDFIDDAVTQGVLTEAMYLQSVQGGFELIDGGAGLSVQDYYVSVNP